MESLARRLFVVLFSSYEDDPQVYFQEDFTLVDPETFEQTCQALGSSSSVLQQEKARSPAALTRIVY